MGHDCYAALTVTFAVDGFSGANVVIAVVGQCVIDTIRGCGSGCGCGKDFVCIFNVPRTGFEPPKRPESTAKRNYFARSAANFRLPLDKLNFTRTASKWEHEEARGWCTFE